MDRHVCSTPPTLKKKKSSYCRTVSTQTCWYIIEPLVSVRYDAQPLEIGSKWARGEEEEEGGGCSAQSTRAAGCYNNSTLVVPSLSHFSPSLSPSDHPLIVCSPLSFGALCPSIKPPILLLLLLLPPLYPPLLSFTLSPPLLRLHVLVAPPLKGKKDLLPDK